MKDRLLDLHEPSDEELDALDIAPPIIELSDENIKIIDIQADLFDEECERGSELSPEEFDREVERRLAEWKREGSK